MAQTDADPPSSVEPGTSPTGARSSVSRLAQPPLASWPKATAMILVGLVVLLAGGTLLVRQLTGTAPSQVQGTATSISADGPTAPAGVTVPAPTLPPAAVAPTPIPSATVTATAAPTAIPTPAPTVAPTAASQTFSVTSSSPTDASPLPTVAPELRGEVEHAYVQYWDARAEAVWTLDPSLLDAVSTGDELLALRRR